MDIGCALAPSIADSFEAGLEGLGVTPTEAEQPTVVAGPIGELPDHDARGAGARILVELGGMGSFPLADVDGAVSVLDVEGPCLRCLDHRVQANSPTRGSDEVADETVRYAGALVGRLLHRVGPDGLDAVLGQVQLIDGGVHEVLPVPYCRCDQSTPISRTGRDEEIPGDAIEHAERAVDDLIGLITQVGEQSSYPAPYYIAQLADTETFSSAQAARHAAGVDLDWNDAFMRALGEALERYCAGVYRLETLPNEPEGTHVDLADIPTADSDADPIGRWWPATNLHTGEDIHLPMETVVFPPPSGADLDAITTGLGLGGTWLSAVLAGLLEVIERDACMLGWYSTFEPLRLSVSSTDYQTLVRRLAGEGLAVTTLLMTQDIDVPVVTAVVHRRDADGRGVYDIPSTDADDWPAFAVGSAASLSAVDAAERALAEAAQNWVELKQLGPEDAKQEGTIATYATFPRQARSLLEYETTVAAEDIGPDGVDDPSEAVSYCLDTLESADLTAYAARTTTRDVEALGFEGVRVVVPEAQPLVQDRSHQTDRLRQAPRALGFQPRLDRSDHPYP